MPPPVPVIVTFAGPPVAATPALNVKELAPAGVTGLALKVAVTPEGNPDKLKVTALLKPRIGRTRTPVLADCPCITLTALADIEKSFVWLEGTTGNEFWMF